MTSQPDQSTPKPAPKPRAGVPVWRVGKPDAVLAAAVDFARAAVEGIVPAEQIGQHLGAKSEGDRVVTHLFESRLAGYQGWQWYAVLTRNSRSKVITVNELGLLPSEDSILAPEWVPWAERVRPEDAQDSESDADAQVADADAPDTALAAFDDDDAVSADDSDDGAAVSDNDDDSDDDDSDDDSDDDDSDDDRDAPEEPSSSVREVD